MITKDVFKYVYSIIKQQAEYFYQHLVLSSCNLSVLHDTYTPKIQLNHLLANCQSLIQKHAFHHKMILMISTKT